MIDNLLCAYNMHPSKFEQIDDDFSRPENGDLVVKPMMPASAFEYENDRSPGWDTYY